MVGGGQEPIAGIEIPAVVDRVGVCSTTLDTTAYSTCGWGNQSLWVENISYGEYRIHDGNTTFDFSYTSGASTDPSDIIRTTNGWRVIITQYVLNVTNEGSVTRSNIKLDGGIFVDENTILRPQGSPRSVVKYTYTDGAWSVDTSYAAPGDTDMMLFHSGDRTTILQAPLSGSFIDMDNVSVFTGSGFSTMSYTASFTYGRAVTCFEDAIYLSGNNGTTPYYTKVTESGFLETALTTVSNIQYARLSGDGYQLLRDSSGTGHLVFSTSSVGLNISISGSDMTLSGYITSDNTFKPLYNPEATTDTNSYTFKTDAPPGYAYSDGKRMYVTPS